MDATLPYRPVHNIPKTVSAGNYEMVNMGNYETVNAGNYETRKDTSSWAVLFTVPVHSLVPKVVL